MVRGLPGVAIGALIVAGCGSSGPSGSHASAPHNGEAAKSPQTIMSDAGAAMRSAGSYVLHATLVYGSARQAFTLKLDRSGSLDLAFAQGPVAAEVISASGAYYLRGNDAYWGRAAGGQLASRLAGLWVKVPQTALGPLLPVLDKLEPRALGRCVSDVFGTMKVAGTTTVDGSPAVRVLEAADRPGATASEYEVATTGPAYLLKATVTGPSLPGGRVDMCNDGKGSTQTGTTFTLSQYGQVPAVQAPAHALAVP